MTDQQMITAILSAIDNGNASQQVNLNALLLTMITNNIGNVPLYNLQAMCTVLNIDYSQGD